jgi:predicted nucleic acid-binding protein
MKPRIYLETSFISYLTARPSRDLIVAAHQQLAHEWWDTNRTFYDIYTSQVVIREASCGDISAVERRRAVLQAIQLLDVSDLCADLAKKLIKGNCLPQHAVEDALHIAIATIHRMNYLLTWNCKHIANAKLRFKMENVIQLSGYRAPIICTPEELIGE